METVTVMTGSYRMMLHSAWDGGAGVAVAVAVAVAFVESELEMPGLFQPIVHIRTAAGCGLRAAVAVR